MPNTDFFPELSTDVINVGSDFTECLTDTLEEMQTNIEGKAEADHTHTEYSPVAHAHKVDTALWSGSNVLIATDTVTPSKPLSACQSGWVLLWSDANTSGAGNDYDYCTTVIPKKNASGGSWGTKAFFCVLPRFSDADLDGINIKTIKISDTAITGDVKNDQGGREDIVLRAVYEF